MSSHSTAWLVVGVIALMILINGFFFWPDIARYLRDRTLEKSGISAQARVIALTDTGDRYNSEPLVDVTLDVLGASTTIPAHAQFVMSPVDASLVAPGKIVQVKYDPSDPSYVLIIDPAQ